MEYEYGAMEGVLFTLESLAELREQRVELVLPSHGPPVTDVAGDLDRLTAALVDTLEIGGELGVAGWKSETPPAQFLPQQRFVELSPHLLWSGSWTCANFYVVLDGDGGALLVDYGHSSWAHLHTGADHHGQESMRFVRHHLPELRRTHGVESIDVVVPTHIHDDHTCGIPYLQQHEGTDCWALDAVAVVLEDPSAWASAPCVYPTPIRIDRRLADGERFAWGGHDFEVRFAPGQTEFASVLGATIDGRRIAFTGDNVFWSAEGRPYETTVLRNSFQPWMHRRCVDVMRDLAPELVCPGHGEVMPWSPDEQERYAAFVERKQAIFHRLVGEAGDAAIDLFWARLVPYVVVARPGETVTHRVIVRNNHGRDVTVGARLRPAAGWSPADPTGWRHVRLESGASGELEFASVAPPDAHPRRAVTVELTVDDEPLGPVVEGVVSTGPRPSSPPE
jgi:glyoxylase-like metal-dependent hydrolase (beta-lactamase superfamily II)